MRFAYLAIDLDGVQDMTNLVPTAVLLENDHRGKPEMDYKSVAFDNMLVPKR